jgi:heavy metal sensor kinase
MRQRILRGILPLTGAALIATAAGLERATYYDLLGALDAQLQSLVRAVGGGIGVEVDGAIEFDLSPEVEAQFQNKGLALYYRIRTEDGRVLEASDTASTAALPPGSSLYCGSAMGAVGFRVCADVLEIEPDSDEEDLEQWARDHPGQPVPKVAPKRFWVEAGMSLSGLKQSLSRFRARLAIGFGALFLVLVLVPVWSVRRALQPVDALSREAEAIDAGNLGARLTEEGVDTEVQALVAALNRALNRVADAYERQKRFTSDAAHELRTPLTALKGRLGVALSLPRGPAEYRTALEELEPQVDRMIRLSSDLLFMARLDQGPSARREPIALPELLAAVVEQVRPLAQARSITLVDPAVGELTVSGDLEHLLRLFLNLLDNAVKFKPPGGQISIAAVRSGSKVSVTIRDTGPGIPVEARAHLFKRFYRVGSDRSRPEGQGGAGLGLAIAHEIARAHGGSLTVGSEDGSGTTVTVNLPLVAPGEGTPLPPRPDS